MIFSLHSRKAKTKIPILGIFQFIINTRFFPNNNINYTMFMDYSKKWKAWINNKLRPFLQGQIKTLFFNLLLLLQFNYLKIFCIFNDISIEFQ